MSRDVYAPTPQATVTGYGNDQMTVTDKCSNSKLLGSIAYRRSVDALSTNYFGGLQSSNELDCLTYEHIVVYEENAAVRTASLNNLRVASGGPSVGGHLLTRVTQIGGVAPAIGNNWTQTGVEDVPALAARVIFGTAVAQRERGSARGTSTELLPAQSYGPGRWTVGSMRRWLRAGAIRQRILAREKP